MFTLRAGLRRAERGERRFSSAETRWFVPLPRYGSPALATEHHRRANHPQVLDYQRYTTRVTMILSLSRLCDRTGIHNYAPRHLDQAVDFLERTIGKYPYEEVMGPTYDLSDLPAAMKLAMGKQYGRVLVKPNLSSPLSASSTGDSHE